MRRHTPTGTLSMAVLAVAAAYVVVPAFADQVVQTDGFWVYVGTSDSITNRGTGSASTVVQNGRHTLRLAIECRNGKVEASADLGDVLGDGWVLASYRVDGQDMVEQTWPLSSDGRIVWAVDGAGFGRDLMSGQLVFIEIVNERGDVRQVTFGLSGAANKIGRVLRNCGIDAPLPARLVTGPRDAGPTGPGSIPGSVGATAVKPSIGVHLASFVTEKRAAEGWAYLEKDHSDLLGALRPEIRRADIPGKGVFYRLIGAGLDDIGAARALCAALEARRQYCRPVRIETE